MSTTYPRTSPSIYITFPIHYSKGKVEANFFSALTNSIEMSLTIPSESETVWKPFWGMKFNQLSDNLWEWDFT